MRHHVIALFLATILAAPTQAGAQLLGSYCNPSQSWCFEAMYLEALGARISPSAGLVFYDFSLRGTFTGSGLDGLNASWAFTMWPDDDRPSWYADNGAIEPLQPGTSTLNTSLSIEELSSWDGTVPDWSDQNLQLEIFYRTPLNEPRTLGCGPMSAWGPCAFATVPEPSTVLLLGTGLFGLGIVAWRRKEREAD